jgi:hypothetical protein
MPRQQSVVALDLDKASLIVCARGVLSPVAAAAQ